MTFKCISIEDSKKLYDQKNLTIIDIRDYQSFLNGHLNNAIHFESINIDAFLKDKDKEEVLLIYCYHGNSSKPAANFFGEKGFKNVFSMDEGYAGWIKN
jgi:thiosulfate sulfurtransferase